MASSADPTALHAHIEKMLATKLRDGPVYSFLLEPVRIVTVAKGHVIARLPLGQNHMNSKGSLHGSVSGTIIDWMGGMAICAWDLRENTGVSLDIHVTYQSSAKLGEELEIEGIAERVGGSVAFTRVAIYKVEEGQRGKPVATGSHTKFVKGTEMPKSSA